MKAYGNIAPLNVQVVREFRGMDNRDSFNIPNEVSTWIHECTTEYYPIIRTRSSANSLGTLNFSNGNGLGAWKNTQMTVVVDGVWKRYDGGSVWTNIQTGLSTSAYCSFCNFQGNLSGIHLLMANGVDPVKKYDGTTVNNLANAPSGIQFIDAHDNRVYGATGNTIYYSGLRKPEDWTTLNDAGSIVVESANGETIVGIRAGLQHLLVFKNNSMYELYGTGPSNFRLIQVSDEIGIVNHRASVTLNGVVYFLHSKGFYRYTGGSQPDKTFSEPIQEIIKNASSLSDYSVVGTDGRFIYVSFYCPGYTGETNQNILMQYNPEKNVWCNFFSKRGEFRDFELMNDEMYGLCGQSVPFSSVIIFGRNTTTDSFNGTSSDIIGTIVTKAFNASLLSQNSRYVRLFISFISYSSNSVTVSYKTSMFNSITYGWTSVGTLSDNTGQLATGRLILPMDALQNKKYIKLRFDLAPDTRIIEYAFEVVGKPLV